MKPVNRSVVGKKKLSFVVFSLLAFSQKNIYPTTSCQNLKDSIYEHELRPLAEELHKSGGCYGAREGLPGQRGKDRTPENNEFVRILAPLFQHQRWF